MPGGLEGRLMREQIKAQKIKNQAAEQQMRSPLSVLQNMAQMQNVLSANDARRSNRDNNIVDLLKIAGFHSDPSNIIQQLLRARGVTGDFQPKAPDMDATRLASLMGMGDSGVDPEMAQRMQEFLIQQQGQQ